MCFSSNITTATSSFSSDLRHGVICQDILQSKKGKKSLHICIFFFNLPLNMKYLCTIWQRAHDTKVDILEMLVVNSSSLYL